MFLSQAKSSDNIPDVLQRIGRTGRLFTRWADTRLEKFGFSVAQLPVLFALKDGDSTTQKRLAHLAQIEQPTMAQLLTRMQRDGLIERSPHPEDNRSSLISLTQLAMKQAAKARGVLLEASDLALKGFSADEVQQLNDFLKRVMDNLENVLSTEL